jgi:site-specific DNA-adenine methylase
MAKQLTAMLPSHRVFVEPFAGGAAVFLHKPLAEVNVIGDYDKYVADFYNQVRNGGLRQCSGGIKKSRGLFARSKKGKSACMKIANTSLSFHGNRTSYVGENKTAKGGTIMQRNKLRKRRAYEKKLRRTHILQGDFAAVMRKFDAPDAVHFLDPPWTLEYSDIHYKGGAKARIKGQRGKGLKGKGTAFDPAHLKRVCKSMQGHVLMIINDDKQLRSMFCSDPSFRCKVLRVPTNIGHRMTVKNNLIIEKPARTRGGKAGASPRTPSRGRAADATLPRVTMEPTAIEKMRVL